MLLQRDAQSSPRLKPLPNESIAIVQSSTLRSRKLASIASTSFSRSISTSKEHVDAMRLIDWHYNQTTMRIREVATSGYTKLVSNEAWEVAAWEAMREAQKEKQWAEDETAKSLLDAGGQ